MTAFARDMTPRVDLTEQRGTGPVTTPASGLCRPAAALQRGLPGRREYPGLARPGAGRRISRRLGGADPRQSHARGAWPGLLSPLRNRLQPQGSRQRRQHSRGGAFSRRPAAEQNWPVPVEAPSSAASAVLVVGAGPSGLSAAYHLTRLGHRGGDPRSGPAARRHAAFRHPRLSSAARGSDEGNRPHRGDGRQDRPQPQGRGRAGRTASRAASTRYSSPSARSLASTSISPRAMRRRVLDAVNLLHDVETGASATAWAARRGLRRRQYRDGRGAHRAAAGRGGGADRLSPRPRTYAGARFRGRRGARRRRQDQVAEHDQGHRRRRSHGRNDGRSTSMAAPQPTGKFETLQADTVVLALGQDAESGFLAQDPGNRVQARRHGRWSGRT